jgi:stearoyl-CoA desaturase (delta-9 desaturase)
MRAGHLVKSLTKDFPTITRVKWLNLIVLVITHALSLYGLLRVPMLTKTIICTACYYIFSMLGKRSGNFRASDLKTIPKVSLPVSDQKH